MEIVSAIAIPVNISPIILLTFLSQGYMLLGFVKSRSAFVAGYVA